MSCNTSQLNNPLTALGLTTGLVDAAVLSRVVPEALAPANAGAGGWSRLLDQYASIRRKDFVQRVQKQAVDGKKRIHSKPDTAEIDACRWWQEGERALLKPPLTVALGATAARSLTGKTVTISKVREAPLTLADGSECWVTVHPSFLLRIPEEDRRREERVRFVEDLVRIRERAAALA